MHGGLSEYFIVGHAICAARVRLLYILKINPIKYTAPLAGGRIIGIHLNMVKILIFPDRFLNRFMNFNSKFHELHSLRKTAQILSTQITQAIIKIAILVLVYSSQKTFYIPQMYGMDHRTAWIVIALKGIINYSTNALIHCVVTSVSMVFYWKTVIIVSTVLIVPVAPTAFYL